MGNKLQPFTNALAYCSKRFWSLEKSKYKTKSWVNDVIIKTLMFEISKTSFFKLSLKKWLSSKYLWLTFKVWPKTAPFITIYYVMFFSSSMPFNIRHLWQLMEQCTLKNVNIYLKTNIYSYLETSSGLSSNLYLNVFHFFNTRVN